MGRGAKVLVSYGSAIALILVMSPSVLRPQESGKGNLIGFVFKQDGSTPVAGAVIVVKNLTSGIITEAPQSDSLGVFKVTGLAGGLYALGVRSGEGDFNSQDLIGVTPEKTAKISIALNPYDSPSAAAAAAIIKEQREKGEAFIGKVVKYLPDTKQAEVLVEIGLIQSEDRIHVKGQVTDFYQDLRSLKAYGAKAKRVLSGYTAVLRASKPCQPGDFVYIVCKHGVPPFFLAPLGMAAIVAGAIPLSATYEDEPVSPFKIK